MPWKQPGSLPPPSKQRRPAVPSVAPPAGLRAEAPRTPPLTADDAPPAATSKSVAPQAPKQLKKPTAKWSGKGNIKGWGKGKASRPSSASASASAASAAPASSHPTPNQAASSSRGFAPRGDGKDQDRLATAQRGPDTRQNNYSQGEIMYMQKERELAARFNVPWKKRGPRPGPGVEMPKTWKGGTWRPTAECWAKKGGKNLEERNARFSKSAQKKRKQS